MFKPSPPPPPSPSLWPPPPPAPSPPSPPPRRAATYRAPGPGLTPEPDLRGAAPGLMGRFLDRALGGWGREGGRAGRGTPGPLQPSWLRRVKYASLARVLEMLLLLSHPLPPQESHVPLLPVLRWDLAGQGPGRAALPCAQDSAGSVRAGEQALGRGAGSPAVGLETALLLSWLAAGCRHFRVDLCSGWWTMLSSGCASLVTS